MEVVCTSETSVNFYQTTRRNIPEDSHLHTRRRENLKYHLLNYNDHSAQNEELFSVYVVKYSPHRNMFEIRVVNPCDMYSYVSHCSPFVDCGLLVCDVA
jgi:hypothetical protein